MADAGSSKLFIHEKMVFGLRGFANIIFVVFPFFGIKSRNQTIYILNLVTTLERHGIGWISRRATTNSAQTPPIIFSRNVTARTTNALQKDKWSKIGNIVSNFVTLKS